MTVQEVYQRWPKLRDAAGTRRGRTRVGGMGTASWGRNVQTRTQRVVLRYSAMKRVAC